MELRPARPISSPDSIPGRSAGPGLPMVLADGSGQIIVEGAATNALSRPSVDVLGRVDLEGSNLVLRYPHFRQFGVVGEETNGLPLLTTAEQICQLSYEEAAKGYPVRVQGVITGTLEGRVVDAATTCRGI